MGDAAILALEQAIKFESDGRDFYLRAAASLADPAAKGLFAALAEDEKDHIRRVREIYEELKDKPGWPSVDAMVARQSGVLDGFERSLADAAEPETVAGTVAAAAEAAFGESLPAAVLIDQRVVGVKTFGK